MSTLITTSNQFRAEVLRNDKATLRQLSGAYTLIERTLKSQLDSLMRDIQDAQKKGITVNQDWLRRSFRYQQLIRQVKAEVAQFSHGADRFIQAKQQQAIDLGQFHATGLIEAALPEITFARLPTEAINELIGVLENGSPLSKVLDRLGGLAAGQIKDALVSGLASGHGAAKIGRAIRDAIDVPRWKALQIARTETIRAYRQSTLQTYAENSDVLNGWIWISTLSTRTCPACWSLHGTFFPLSKQFFPGHVSCRCTSIPSVKGSSLAITSGAEAFSILPVEQQITILGPAKWEMFVDGTPLSDFVVLRRDRQWGSSYQVRPLYQLKRKKAA
jgi:SPP1 gp7 family putative phage head morphogenesis protein